MKTSYTKIYKYFLIIFFYKLIVIFFRKLLNMEVFLFKIANVCTLLGNIFLLFSKVCMKIETYGITYLYFMELMIRIRYTC